MLVDLSDGCCRSCQGQLEVVDADDSLLFVACIKCADNYIVEPDAFNDGGLRYWPAAMFRFCPEMQEEP